VLFRQKLFKKVTVDQTTLRRMLSIIFLNFYIKHDDYDHADGVRLRPLTAINNDPTVHPQVIFEHEEPWWNDVDTGRLLIRPPELSAFIW
jgi:hypothetical protein